MSHFHANAMRRSDAQVSQALQPERLKLTQVAHSVVRPRNTQAYID